MNGNGVKCMSSINGEQTRCYECLKLILYILNIETIPCIWKSVNLISFSMFK